MIDSLQVATDYMSAWNEEDADRRLALLKKGWVSGATYVDPMGKAQGIAGINDLIGGARAQFPGHSFALRGTPDGHGDLVRFSWTLLNATGAAVAGGTDVATLDASARIVSVIGFLDQVQS